MSEEQQLHPMLKILMPLVDALGELFGPECEVVLHDLSKPKNSVIKIANGEISGRKIGDTIRDLILTVLRSKDFTKDRLVNYLTKTNDGKLLKSSTTILRDESGDIIGAICINYDIGRFIMAQKLLTDFCQTTDLNELSHNKVDDSEEVGEDVIHILKQLINKTIMQMGKPVSVMVKEDKLEVVRFLDEKGVFLIKGAVEFLANELKISRYTVYSYLDLIRSNKMMNQ